MNGFRSTNDSKIGTTVQFGCITGFEMLGEKNISCQPNGIWSGPIPSCRIVTCLVPPPPPRGRIFMQGNSSLPSRIRYGQKLQYACTRGYQLLGSRIVMCQSDRTFNDTVPTCSDINECSSMPCRGASAICSNLIASYKCSCKPGYEIVSPDTCAGWFVLNSRRLHFLYRKLQDLKYLLFQIEFSFLLNLS